MFLGCSKKIEKKAPVENEHSKYKVQVRTKGLL